MEKIYRINKSRRLWKLKAVLRMNIIGLLRKQVHRLRRKTRELLKENEELKRKLAEKESSANAPSSSAPQQPSKDRTRSLCVILVIHSVISFRSVPRILNTLVAFGIFSVVAWIPHFTSVIHWVLRLGLYRLRVVGPQTQRWIAIIDCSIDVGVQKALVALRVRLDALAKRGNAITLTDVECIGVKIGSHWNGETVQDALDVFFEQSGRPAAILKDGGTDLNKGVACWREENQAKKSAVIEDIGHVAANALKAEFADLKAFEQFLEVASRGSARIRQTVLASFMSPKIRTKGRFQGISRVADWAEKILNLISGAGRAAEDSVTTGLRRAFEGLSAQRPFIERFQLTCRVTNQVLELLKNEGLNQANYRRAKELLQQLHEGSITRSKIEQWLHRHLGIQNRLGMGQQPLLVSSDIIESLFGKFKITLQRSPLAEMTALVLTIPALCGSVGPTEVQQALQTVSHADFQTWTKKNVPPTMRQTRSKVFDLRRGEWVPEIGKYG